MNVYLLILIIVIFVVLGLVLYKAKRYEFTVNSKFILNLLFNELDGIYSRLEYGHMSDFEKMALIDRKNEIEYTLEQFYGKKLI